MPCLGTLAACVSGSPTADFMFALQGRSKWGLPASPIEDGKGNLYGTSQAGSCGTRNSEGQLGCATMLRLKE